MGKLRMLDGAVDQLHTRSQRAVMRWSWVRRERWPVVGGEVVHQVMIWFAVTYRGCRRLIGDDQRRCFTSARAIATRCAGRREPVGHVACKLGNADLLQNLSTRRLRSAVRCHQQHGYSTFSNAVSPAPVEFWNTKPMRWRRSACAPGVETGDVLTL